METYGLTEYDLLVAREKIKQQKKYLTDNELITSNGQVKSLLDLSFSANHSYRYYAQLANKINVIEQLAFNNGLVPIFTTMTLDGFYRDLLRGDYKRFILMGKDKREEAFKSVPNNDRFGYIRDKIQNLERLTVKDLYKILLAQNHQFRKGTAFKQLLKAGYKFEFIRTVEPHKDGVPHFHMMLFIPESFIDLFHKDFKRYFIAPRNQRKKAFQKDINSASAYIMKYITKTFIDIKKDKELDYINAWFVKHRIMRCVTSRSTLPQWIYKKISIINKDWFYLTDILNSDNSSYTSEWSQKNDYFYIYDNWSNYEFEYLCGQLSIYRDGKLKKRVGKIVEKPYVMTTYEKIPLTWTTKKENKPIPIYENNKITMYFKNGKFTRYQKHISDMSDFELYEYYTDYDLEDTSQLYQKYLGVRNEMIKRDLLNSKLYSLNNFDLDKFLFDN